MLTGTDVDACAFSCLLDGLFHFEKRVFPQRRGILSPESHAPLRIVSRWGNGSLSARLVSMALTVEGSDASAEGMIDLFWSHAFR